MPLIALARTGGSGVARRGVVRPGVLRPGVLRRGVARRGVARRGVVPSGLVGGPGAGSTDPGAPADDEHDVRNDLLTLARIWATLETEAIMPKDAAAEWAASRLTPDHAVPLLAARRQYLDGHHGTAEWRTSMPAARATAYALVQAIEGLA
ncbi:MAG TPA: aminoglycoside adenylyltransferase domain-containing protein [Candidatus Limnocylindrales bacterium]|nr:aminoglycoside adenylyltransferase domain-containing protein [Candidatus Limnocylindrales bacterium]